MELKILSESWTEPVTVAEAKSFMGYPSTETTQDTIITAMIKAAREFVEQRTALSLVSKSYQAHFTEDDADENGWYELPVSPVLTSPAITVTSSGVSTTFQSKGMNKKWIKPDAVIGTALVGQDDDDFESYTDVVFQAGATNATANECIKQIVEFMFNNRGVSNLSISVLPYATRMLLHSISQNIV